MFSCKINWPINNNQGANPYCNKGMIKKIAKRLSISQPGSAPKSSNAMKVASGMFRKKGSSVKNWKSRRYIITDDGM